MAYIAPIHRPSSVHHALLANVYSGEEESLVLSRTNRIEVWRPSPDGLLSQAHTTTINGTIAMLQKLRPKDAETDLLFVGTDRFEYFTLVWDPETSQLETTNATRDPGEHFMRNSQSLDRAIVDPSGRFLAMHLWEGVLTIARLGARRTNAATIEWLGQIRLAELFIKASTFLHNETGHPTVAFLYQSSANAQDSKLATYRLTSDDRHTVASEFNAQKHRIIDVTIPDAGANMLIPVRKGEEEVKRHNVRNTESAKAHLGGFIIVGETRLLYIDDVTKATVESKLDKASIFVRWAEYNVQNYFLADDYGSLHLLTIDTEGVVVKGMILTKIGVTSRASELVYLGNDMLFVASHYGDSQLFQLDLSEEKPTDKPFLRLVQTISNIGPIMDFAVMDMGNRGGEDSQLGNEYSSGQARIVCGSGVYKDGSLRSVRSGVGLEDVGLLLEDLGQHVRGVFSLRGAVGPGKTDTLVVSFLTETRVFRFDSEGGIEEVGDFMGFDLSSQTLLAKNLAGGILLQVTTRGVVLVDTESGVTIATWTPQGRSAITNASANREWLLLSVEGTGLVSISIIGNELQVVKEKDIGQQDQVACIHVAPQLQGIGVVGFWTSGTVSIIDLKTLKAIHGESLRQSQDDASIPREVVLVQVLSPKVSGPTLFIAMEDGHVVTFNISPDFNVSGKKQVILGTRQARLHLLQQENESLYSILATTEHPSLIYGEESRIVYSAVTAEEATFICPFDTEAFPDSIIVATDTQIKISKIDRTRRTHLRELPMGEMVRRIAYSPKEKVFGLGCIKRSLVDGDEVVQSSFRLVDEVIFQPVGKTFHFDRTNYLELVEAVIRAELPDSYGNPAERFIVGTSFLPDPDYAISPDQHRGRILVFGVDDNRDPYLILSHPTKGVCRCLEVLDGNKIVAGLAKTVAITQYEETSTTTATLKKLAFYKPSTYPIQITVQGNLIGVADVMKSMTLVEYIPAGKGGNGTDKDKLVEVARHWQSASGTALCHVDGDDWLEADDQGNLMMLRRNTDAVVMEDRKIMNVTAEINLGEMVNRIRSVRVETGRGAMVVPRAFLGTVGGGIYMFGTIAPEAQDLLLRFQENLARVVQTAGEMEFYSYRAFRNAEREGNEPVRFLDGELLERFLDQDEATQKEICEGLGPSLEQMRNIVEELRRMH
ncbi:mono-functional DNA-alkylating methyl methanesulfonate N-term-domain-containing protein [Triangularia verruculosa]|uniref:Mono-functional DNA-alkylating methyl methanesulfonate N-term-domain-containing protein n=1 Tax=Triangularia verruculosa TaxID=2587418 RepID=A0AAN6XM23_9PEZI|nr:mono-functional DNA-alkylating methyl methanesulfonate N-term-domain-containing protein [Triangularia verruculosa]